MVEYPVLIKIIDCTTGDYLFQIPPQKVLDAKFTKKLNDVGIASFTLAYNTSIIEYFSLDNFVEVYIYSMISQSYEKFETYLVRIVRDYYEENIHYYAIGGVSLNDLFRRRIIDPEVDGNAAGGFVTLGDYAHVVMYELINEHMVNSSVISRNIPNLTIEYGHTKTILAGIRDRHKELLPLLQKVAQKGEIDFTIYRDTGNNLVAHIGVIGSDRTKTTNYPTSPYTTLNPDHRTLINPSYENDRKDEKNYIYLLDKESDEEIIAIKYLTSDTLDSPYNLIEFTKTVNVESFEEKLTEAIEELKGNRQKNLFNYTLPNNSKTINLALGDKITLYWNGITKDIRLDEVLVTLNNNIYNRQYKVSDILT